MASQTARGPGIGDDNVDVFINCPFDDTYRPLFRASIFAVIACGFRARCALEISDAATVRIEKIYKIISECGYGVHDISRTELDEANGLPRFNMPLELGIFLGCKRFGPGRQNKKVALVMDREKYRYQKFISDLAGVDVEAHADNPEAVLAHIRDWLRNTPGKRPAMGSDDLKGLYRKFCEALPDIAKELGQSSESLTFPDYEQAVTTWLQESR